ncbi:unnamed protein product [Albugo candida]|uniref:EF-hand domain-containing protein n=1 Tax=Albugo candida TaxID=65357 RepID=A0A024G6V4_9STRA|nr:unnamed protein product [Albugo candida]|eukprot:CCI42473.1 unnamed protein product [Albugo candida]
MSTLTSLASSPTHQPLPVSLSSIDADIDLELPFVHEIAQRSLTIQAKRAVTIQNALVASQLHHFTIHEAQKRLKQIKRSENDISTFLTQQESTFDAYLTAFYEFLLPLKPGESFRPIETVLKRMYMTFSQVAKKSGKELFIATLVLLPGDLESKLDTAIELALFERPEERCNRIIRANVLQEALHCLLLSIIAIFEQENVDTMSLISTNDVVIHCVRNTVAQIFKHQNSESVTFGQLWSCLEDLEPDVVVPWLKYIDTTQWPKSKRLNGTSSPMHTTLHTPSVESALIQVDWDDEEKGEKSHEVQGKGEKEDVSARSTPKPDLTFIFSGVDGGTLAITSTAAETLFDIVKWTCWTRMTPNMIYETFLRHTEDGLLEEKTFFRIVEELLSRTTSNPPRKDGFSDLILDVFKSFTTTKLQHVDAIELAAGFSLLTWGSKSDKLAAAFYFFDVDGKGYLNSQQLWRFLRSILIMLLFLSPPSDGVILRHGSIFGLVDTGEQEILENITEGIHEDLNRNEGQNVEHTITTQNWGEEFTFADFGAWYNSGGFKAISWLELLDLRKWTFVSQAFQVDLLDTTPVRSSFTFEKRSEENWGKDVAKEEDPLLLMEMDEHSRHHKDSSTLPGIVLKHDIILEFDLPVDIEVGGGETGKRPFSALCLDNGDLLSYFELQRVTKFDQVSLSRLLEVFTPFFGPSNCPSWSVRSVAKSMDKDTFDACIQDLLPASAKRGLREAQLSKTFRKSLSFSAQVYPAFLSSMSRIYFAFNRAGTGKVDLKELVSSFSLFFAGSKSEKLAFAFRLFDVDRDGSLTRREMWRFLRSFMTLLLVLGNGCDLSAQALANIVDSASICITNMIFKDTRATLEKPSFVLQKAASRCSLDQEVRSIPSAVQTERRSMEMTSEKAGNDVVSFDAFAQWYSMHGYNIIAWIELLDAKKWPEVPSNVRDAILKFTRRQNAAMQYVTQEDGRTYRASSTDTGKSQTPKSFSEKDDKRASISTDRTWSIHSENERYSSEALEADQVKSTAKLPTSTSDELTDQNGNAQALNTDIQTVAFQFHSEVDGKVTLQIRLKDVAIVYTISERLELRSMSCNDLLDRLKAHARKNQMSKKGYLMAVRSLVSAKSLVKEEQEFLSFHMLRIYFMFEIETIVDAEESSENKEGQRSSMLATSSSVHLAQLVAGLSVFCGTSKGPKLSLLFRLFSHKEGYVHRRHLFDMFRSILAVLFAFSAYSARSNSENVDEWNTSSIAGQYASELISKVFIQTKCKHADYISLEEFAAWYGAGGYISCPWLELLDLTKWPAAQAFNATRQQAPPVYAFDISEENNILHFSESDISSYLTMLNETKLPDVPLGEIFDAVVAYTTPIACRNEEASLPTSYSHVNEERGKVYISRKRFYECIRSVIPNKPDSEKAQQLASKLLSRIYNSFDRKGVNQVSVMELACGLSILGKGSKSHKLELAFEFVANMLQQGHRGGPNPSIEISDTRPNRTRMKALNSLSQPAMFLFLRSFLLALMALSDVTYRLGMERMYIEADEFIEEVLSDFLNNENGADAKRGSTLISRTRNRITFEQFGEWYNKGGYQMISWVELLDVAKWEQQSHTEPKKTTKSPTHTDEETPAISNIKTRKMAVSINMERMSSRVKRINRVHVRQSDIALEPFKNSPTRITRDSGHVLSYRPISTLSDAPLLVFATAENAAELQFFSEDLLRLESFVSETQLHRMTADDLVHGLQLQLDAGIGSGSECDTHTTSSECVTRAIEICCPVNKETQPSNASLLSLSEESIDLLYMLCEAFVHDEGSRHSGKSCCTEKNINVKWLSSGMLLLCGGTMLEKLKCSCRLLAAPGSSEIASDANVSSDALQDSLTAFLMGLYGISCSFSGEITRYSAQLGAQAVMKAFMSSDDSDNASDTLSESKEQEETYEVTLMTQMVSLQDFDNWFRKKGIHTNSWLELIDLKNWPAGAHFSG